jgi:O-antigen ligase
MAASRRGEGDRLAPVMNAGLILIVIAIIPGLGSPFSVAKESLVCFSTSFVLLLVAFRGRWEGSAWPRPLIALLLAGPIAVTLTALANGVGLVAVGGVLRWWTYVFYFVALRLAYPNAATVEHLFDLLAILGGFEGGLVVLQSLFGGILFDTSQLPSAKWHAFGTLGNPNWTGAFLAATLPFAVVRLARPAASAAGRAGAWFTVAALVSGLVITLGRGAWLAAAVGLAVVVSLSAAARKRRVHAPIAAGLVIGIAAVVAAHGYEAVASVTRGESIAGRLRMWRVTMDMIAERPLLGWGLGGFAAAYPAHQGSFLARREDPTVTDITDHPHQEYLYLSAETGLVATAVLVASVAFVALRKKPGVSRARLAAPLGALVALAVNAGTDIAWHLPATTVVLCIALFAACAMTADADTIPASVPIGPAGRVALAAAALLLLAQGSRWLLTDGSLARARAALAAADPLAADEYARKGLSLDVENGELWRVAAHARAAIGDDEGAVHAAEAAMSLAPGVDLAYLLATVWRRSGQPERAAEMLRTWSAILPGLLRPHVLLADIYLDSGDDAGARAELQRVATMRTKFDGQEERQLRSQARDELRRLEALD